MNKAALLLLCGMMVHCATARRVAAVDYLVINALSSPVEENFDTIGSAADASLPFGWSLGSASSSGGTLHTQRSAGTTGDGALTGTIQGGYYNFANGVNATSTDRSVGFLADSFFTPNKSLFLQLRNNTGTTINQLNLSFDIEKYRSGI
jgi:hypothetical protein